MASAVGPNDKGKRLLALTVADLGEDEKNYFEVLNLCQEKYDDIINTCVWMPIGDDLVYAQVPLELAADHGLNFFRRKQNVKILEKPNEHDQQVFLPGILVQRHVSSPQLSEQLLEKLGNMSIMLDNKYVHIQSFVHLMHYWAREAYNGRKSLIQHLILAELRKKKIKDMFTRNEIKTIRSNILSVVYDITHESEKEMFYILSSIERLRMFRDKAPYTFENIDRYYKHMAFSYCWKKRVCGCCFRDCDINEFGGFKSCRYGPDSVVTVVNKEELLNQMIYCCDQCVSTEKVYELGIVDRDDFYYKQTPEGAFAMITNNQQALEYLNQQKGFER